MNIFKIPKLILQIVRYKTTKLKFDNQKILRANSPNELKNNR